MNRITPPADSAKELYQRVLQSIVEGHYHKGDQLPTEREWAQTLGVSRPTIREAIKSLELTGIIDSIQGSGHFISRDLSHSLSKPVEMMFLLEGGSTSDILDLRKAIEIMAAQKAAVYSTAADVEYLSGILDEMAAIILNKTAFYEAPRSIPELDQRFHQKIVDMSRNPLLISVMFAAENLFHSQMLGMAERIAHEDAATNVDYINMNNGLARDLSTLHTIHGQHQAILKAIVDRDATSAASAIADHLDYVDDYNNRHP